MNENAQTKYAKIVQHLNDWIFKLNAKQIP